MRVFGLLALALAFCLAGRESPAPGASVGQTLGASATAPQASPTIAFEQGTSPLPGYFAYPQQLFEGEPDDSPEAIVEFADPVSLIRLGWSRTTGRDKCARARPFLIPYVTGPPLA